MADQMDSRKRLLLLQITDSVFPIGGYSHSYGLETYIQQGLVAGDAQAEAYIRDYIRGSFCHNELLAVRFAYEAAKKEDFDRLRDLENRIGASKSPMETRTAGQKLAARFIKTAGTFTGAGAQGVFERYGAGKQTHTYTVAYGVFCACADIDMKEALLSFGYSQVSALLTNCVKSIPLSQLSGQKILNRLLEDISEAVRLIPELSEEQFLLSYPGLDLRCMQHEDLYSRLYMS